MEGEKRCDCWATQAFRKHPLNINRRSKSPVTATQCVARTWTSRRASASDSSKRSLIRSHRKLSSTTATAANATPVENTSLLSHLDCPDKGQFGVNVIAQAALSRYEYRLPYRKIADRFEQLRGPELSPVSAWYATERAARAGRSEHEQIRSLIQDAAVVCVDEIESDAMETRRGSGRLERTSTRSTPFERVVGMMFPRKSPARTSRERSSVMGGRPTQPSAVICSGVEYIFPREAEDVATNHAAAKPIYRRLKRMYVGLQTWLETDPASSHRNQMKTVVQAGLGSLADQSATTDPGNTARKDRRRTRSLGPPTKVSQRLPRPTMSRRTLFLSPLFCGRSSGPSALISGRSCMSRCCPCWRRGASRDAILTRNSSGWLGIMRWFHGLTLYPRLILRASAKQLSQ